MNSINLNIRKTFCLLSALLTFWLLISALLMSVGIAFGRYYTAESLDISFDIKEKERPKLSYAVPSEKGGTWESVNGTYVLAFSLSNATEDGVSVKDQRFRVRLFVPVAAEGSTDPLGNVSLNLVVGSKSYAATREELSYDTALYKMKNSPGWIYYYDLSGEELVHTLAGGAEATLDMSLHLLGGTPPDDYELIIDPVYVSSAENSN